MNSSPPTWLQRTSAVVHMPSPWVLWLVVASGALLSGSGWHAIAPAEASPGVIVGGGIRMDHDADALWSWPLEPLPAVRRSFDPPASKYGRGHRGVDMDARVGQSVHAVDAGTVTPSGMGAGRGTVTLRHAGGLESTYEPLEERVATGALVPSGAVIGTIGGPSHCTGRPCLHLGARLGEDYLDPMLLLGGVRIVLLPLLD